MRDSDEIYAEMDRELGLVPGWAREIPPEQLEGFWSQTKNFEMGETVIPGKYKDLIGLAVAATIPCEYCVVWHKDGARAKGASEDEIREAVGVAANVRFGSSILNGVQPDMGEFRGELDRILAHVKERMGEAPSATR